MKHFFEPMCLANLTDDFNRNYSNHPPGSPPLTRQVKNIGRMKFSYLYIHKLLFCVYLSYIRCTLLIFYSYSCKYQLFVIPKGTHKLSPSPLFRSQMADCYQMYSLTIFTLLLQSGCRTDKCTAFTELSDNTGGSYERTSL